MFFEHLQGWGLNYLLGQPGPMPDHSFSKEIFPNIQSKPPLTQPEATSSHPMASYLAEETNTHQICIKLADMAQGLHGTRLEQRLKGRRVTT